MILYDDKQNFLGMSSHTLSFLGYEDIGDFLSLHNDFANLFVNKEGYIYKFDNFNWIDFVLYSGSANKKAIITLKNGQETNVDISIKEVHLTHPLDGANKLYSVKILSESFHKIAGVPKTAGANAGGFSLDTALNKGEQASSETLNLETKQDTLQNLIREEPQQQSSGIGGFSLGGLVSGEKTKQEIVKDDFLSLDDGNKEVQKEQNESFILNIDDEVSTKKEETKPETLQTQTTSTADEDIRLDFMKVDTPKVADTQASDFILKEPETKIEEDQENSLKSFLLKDDSVQKEEVKKQESYKEEESAQSAFGFHLLQSTEDAKTQEVKEVETFKTEEEPQESVLNLLKQEEPQTQDENLNFLINQDESASEPKETTQLTTHVEDSKEDESGFKLDFLKAGSIPQANEEIVQEKKEELVTSETKSEEFKIKQKSQEIIQQIKDDIKEIDAEYKKTNSKTIKNDLVEDDLEEETFSTNDAVLKSETFSLGGQKSVTEKEPESRSQEFEDEKENMANFQIKENQTVDTNKSFTSTLKGLFENTNNSEIESQTKDKAFAFSLKSDQNDEKTETLETKEEPTVTEKSIQKDEVVATPKKVQEFKLASLSSLGLDPDDEFDLLSDFISDARESIETIEQFIQTEDFDKINYALVKIKSSAEILSLDAIIENSNSMRKHCITEESKKVTEDTENLKENIKLLEKHLEATAI